MSVDFFEDGQTTNPKRTRKGSETPILDNFSRDLTKLANEGKIDPVIGRDKEVKRIAQILSRRKIYTKKTTEFHRLKLLDFLFSIYPSATLDEIYAVVIVAVYYSLNGR